MGDSQLGLYVKDFKVRTAIIAWVWGAYLGDEGLQNGIRAKISSFLRHHVDSGMTKAKICGNYVNSIFAKKEAISLGFDEAIMLDTEGYVAEASGENIFTVKKGRIKTTPLTSILPGITRACVVQIARDLGYVVVEEKFTRDELCGIWRVPPHKVASLDRSTNNNIEHQGLEFVTDCLGPYLTRIESRVRKQLLKPEERATLYLKFNAAALMRGDHAGRAAFYRAGLGSASAPGWLSPNDVCRFEDMDIKDDPGADEIMTWRRLTGRGNGSSGDGGAAPGVEPSPPAA
jgi:hypothetical protein